MRGVLTLQSTKQIGIGNGLLQIGKSIKTLQTVGSLTGSTTETVTREVIEVFDGTPQLKVFEEVVKETARITCTCQEKNPRILAMQMGLNPEIDLDNTRSAETKVSVTGEVKYLFQENPNYLYYMGVTDGSVHVWTNTATPVDIPEVKSGDQLNWKFDYESGTIQRVEGGVIEDGQDVLVDYEGTQAIATGLHTGGVMFRNKLYVRFIYINPDGGRHVTEYDNAYPGPECAQTYNLAGVNSRELVFDAVANMGLPEGQRLRKQFFEKPLAIFAAYDDYLQ